MGKRCRKKRNAYRKWEVKRELEDIEVDDRSLLK
jgi:hypothetical protein